MCGFAFFPTKIILEKLAGFVCPELVVLHKNAETVHAYCQNIVRLLTGRCY